MSLESSIKDIVSQKLEDGTVERIITEHIEKGIERAVSEIFRDYGSGTKTIRKQIEAVIMPFLERYDYSEYVLKLDDVLTEVLQATTAENRNLLSNFKKLMTPEVPATITITTLFERWMGHVAKHIDTSGLNVSIDDGPGYEDVEVTFEFSEDERRSWSARDTGRLVFECEHDKDMNFEIGLHKWDNSSDWDIESSQMAIADIRSLRNMTEFEVFIMALRQNGTRVVIDKTTGDDSVTPDEEPEATFN